MIERRTVLRNHIEAKGEASIDELCLLFPDKSAMTIRRDLAYLEQSGAIIRTHGGARSRGHFAGPLEPLYTEREAENPVIKEKLAMAAIAYVEERRSIFIDAGTTAMAFASRLPDSDLTIVTSAPNIALHIVTKKPACSVLLTGGTLNRKTLSCSGYGSAELLRRLNIDIAFMAASGYSVSAGFTAGEHFECEVKRIVLSKAEKVIMLMDSSKVGKSMPYTFARPQDVDILITDAGLPPEIEKTFQAKQVTVVKAK